MNDTTKEQVEANYRQIKLDVVEIIEREKERIANDPELRHLVEKEGKIFNTKDNFALYRAVF